VRKKDNQTDMKKYRQREIYEDTGMQIERKIDREREREIRRYRYTEREN
jgi:hypothetical protein